MGLGLKGCAVLVAFTDAGVHIAHYWEVPGFTYGFQEDVLDFVENGKAAFDEEDEDDKKKKITYRIPASPALISTAELVQGAIIHILSQAKTTAETEAYYREKLTMLESTILGPQKNAKKGPKKHNDGPFKDANVREVRLIHLKTTSITCFP